MLGVTLGVAEGVTVLVPDSVGEAVKVCDGVGLGVAVAAAEHSSAPRLTVIGAPDNGGKAPGSGPYGIPKNNVVPPPTPLIATDGLLNPIQYSPAGT